MYVWCTHMAMGSHACFLVESSQGKILDVFLHCFLPYGLGDRLSSRPRLSFQLDWLIYQKPLISDPQCYMVSNTYAARAGHLYGRWRLEHRFLCLQSKGSYRQAIWAMYQVPLESFHLSASYLHILGDKVPACWSLPKDKDTTLSHNRYSCRVPLVSVICYCQALTWAWS